MKRFLKFFLIGTISVYAVVSHGGYDINVVPSFDTTLRGGWFALGSNMDSVKGVEIAARPTLSLSLQTQRTTASATYSFSAVERWLHYSKKFSRDSFNLQHSLSLQHQYRLSRRATLQSSATAGWGETSFSQALVALGSPEQPSLSESLTETPVDGGVPVDVSVDVPVDAAAPTEALAGSRQEAQSTQFVNLNASTGLSYNLTSRQNVDFTLGYGATRQVGTGTADTSGAANSTGTTHNYTASSRYSLQLSPRDDLSANASGGFVQFSTGNESILLTSTMGVRHQFSQRSSISIQGGAAIDLASENNGNKPSGAKYWRTLLPLGDASVTFSPLINGRVPWSLTAGVSASSYVDPVRTEVLPRLAGNVGVSSQITPRMRFQTTLTVSTVVIESDRNASTGNLDFPANARLRTDLIFDLTPSLGLTTFVMTGANSTYPFRGKREYGGKELLGGVTLAATFTPAN